MNKFVDIKNLFAKWQNMKNKWKSWFFKCNL